MVRKLRPSPALVIAGIALFFAIGGSAFAVVGRTEAAQPRCSPGSVRGIAYVTGNPLKGMPNMPDQFSSAENLFGYRWNCSGGAISVRKNGDGFDVRFAGNAATLGLGTAIVPDGGAVAVKRNADGSFHVAPAGDTQNANFRARNDMPFMIVLV
jgi:hypothetical protein